MAELRANDRSAVESAIFAGQKIEAVKLYREAVAGTGLAEAKAAVEAIETELRRVNPEKFLAATGKAGCMGMILIVVGFVSAGLITVMIVVGN